MGDNYKEVCWHNRILKEASQILPLRCPSEDTWEQSQDTASNTELSRDSIEVDLKSQNVSSTKSQANLLYTDAISQNARDTNVHVPTFVESTENFIPLGENPKRRSGDTSIENSPKRMNFGGTHNTNFSNSASAVRTNTKCAMLSSTHKIDSVSTESISENNENSEECQVVPRITSAETVRSNNILQSVKSVNNYEKSKKRDAIVTVETVESDEMIPKPRQTSVDSILDSGLGDSCNSVDSTEEKFDIGELKNRRLERDCWQPKIRESLATRLPENTYYQLMPGKYIFPGAEVYTEPEDYDQCSLSANSESTDSDSDISSGEEEDDEEEGTCAVDDLSESADSDADSDCQNNDSKQASDSCNVMQN